MFRHLLLAIALVLTTSVLVFSQTGSGSLKGKITDKTTKEAISFANVIVEIGGVQVGGATSDFDGNFLIKPVPPGKVDVKATYVGYTSSTITGVVILADKITFQDIQMQPQVTALQEVEVQAYKVPLISKDQTVSGGTVTSDEIAKMAGKSATAVATTVGGVGTDANGNITSMRGQRSSGTVYYIDGIRVVGSSALPQSAIEQVEVILGGTPASYGDATGGIISVTTKGPSRDFAAGIDAQTSQYLDNFGYNRVGMNFTGPLFSRKDTVTHSKTPIMGYFVAGEFVYQKDGNPSAYPLYKVNDSKLDELRKYPLRLSGNGEGVFYSAEYLTMNDLEKTKYTLNSAFYNVNGSAKFDIRLSPTINVSLGGTLQMNDGRDFDPSTRYAETSAYTSSLMNYMYNTHSTSNTWRVNGRFTQRFPTAQDSKSLIKNVFYSISGDFSRAAGKTEDVDHKDNLFKYGYIGSFETYRNRAYSEQLGYDSVSGKVAYKQNGFRDTAVVYKPEYFNPEEANWTSQYYSLFNKTGYYENINQIIQHRGLINGMEPPAVDELWANVGSRANGYNYYQQDQYSVQAFFSSDFGNHSIQFGLQYQQRKNASWAVSGTGLWEVMRGLTNSHLLDLDLSNPQLVYRDGLFMDTINYFRKYVPILQKNFDISLRNKLGLPVDGVDFIDLDSYNFSANTINYYDKNQQMHVIKPSSDILSIDMFSADELLNNGSGQVAYYGYDYKGKKLTSKPSFNDFFTETDEKGNFTRRIGAYEPIYMAGFIQDKFDFKDLIFNIGVRADRFDANQMVLKDPYLFYPAKTASEVTELNGNPVVHPAGVGGDYVVYVNDIANPTTITGYRSGNQWYNAQGTPVSSSKIVDPTQAKPYLQDPSNQVITQDVFKDYEPQWNFMPRISFSFPISDDALFYAHYDILTQRPTSGVRLDPVAYYYIDIRGSSGTINNPNLQPEKTIDYELGFQQKINMSSSLKLSVFYREMRDQIQQYRLSGAYPKTYYSYTNIDFGTVKGLTLSYDLRRTGNARVRFNYTLQFADGTGSDADASSTLIRSDQPNLRSLNPLSFDRRHAFNISIDYRWATGKEYTGPVIKRKKGKAPIQILSNFGGNLTVTGGSGTPYTKSNKVMPKGNLGPITGSVNGSRLPWEFLLNLRIDKDIAINVGKNGSTINVYLEILNLLNTHNVTIVYPATGSAKDDGYLTAQEYQQSINTQTSPQSYRDLYSIYINNPYNYSTPRQTRLGVSFNF